MGDFFIGALFFGLLGFLFPVFVYLDAYGNVQENKCWFSIGIYKYFKLAGGYAQIRKEGIVFHLSKKKAVIVPYADMTATRKKFEITKGFQLYRFHQIVEAGLVNEPAGITVAAAIQALSAQVFSVLQTTHPFISLKNSTLLSEERGLKVTVQAVAVFNGLVLSVAFAKKLLEAFLNWIRRKKSTASWKKRQNN
ncbi:MAG: hypothetical protein ACI4NG_00570 [Candidatus Gallimonas sp.]